MVREKALLLIWPIVVPTWLLVLTTVLATREVIPGPKSRVLAPVRLNNPATLRSAGPLTFKLDELVKISEELLPNCKKPMLLILF